MATGDNHIRILSEPGSRITCKASAAVSAGHFVTPSADIEASPILNTTTPLTGGGNIVVAHTGAAAKALGVALTDIASGDPGPVICAHDAVVQVVSSGAITAGAEVESNATGVAVALAAGRPCGMAVTTAASNLVFVRLY